MNMIELMYGDCLEEMNKIESGSVDVLLSDIPYGISFDTWDIKHDNKNSALLGSSPAQRKSKLFKTRGKPKNGWSKDDNNIGKDFEKFCCKWLTEAKRVLKPASSVICFTGRQYQHNFVNSCESVGLIFKDTISWNKKKAPFRAQRISQVYKRQGLNFDNDDIRLGNLAPLIEPIVWLFKPYRIGGTITQCYKDYGTGVFSSEVLQNNLIEYPSSVKEKKHPTEKPVGLMEILIKTFSSEGQTVLDPFMGCGSTGVACMNLNRNFIGIELDENYFNISKDRMANHKRD